VNFSALGKMRSHPSIHAKMRMDPLHLDTKLMGGMECEVGRMSAYVGEVGIRFAIPFMRPRRKIPLVASVGGFNIRLKPFHLKLKGISLHVAATAGAENGVSGEVEAKVACETEMDVKGKLPHAGRINIDFCNAEELID
jgi:hypothetical protein